MQTDHPDKIGPYEIMGPLGQGSMGRVYKAVQPSLNRVVAIKVLPEKFSEDPERAARFEREAQAVAMLSHPNVVHIIEKGEEDGQLYFVMEYVPGTSLDAIMRRRRLSLPEALSVFKGVSAGLEAAHRQNIVHRDLNPRNVLVDEELSVVKLADFGISKVESLSRELGTLTTGQVSMGTLHYMAPEQASSMAEVDHRADIYSLGVLFYEMLTGRVPVGRFSLPSQLNNEVPPDVDPIILRCLETDAAKRYATVGQLRQAVRQLEDRLRLGLVRELKGFSQGTSKILLRSTQTFAGRPKTVLIGLGVAALVAVLGAGFFWMWQRSEPGAPPPVAVGPAAGAEAAQQPEEGAEAMAPEEAGDQAAVAETGPPPAAEPPRETGEAATAAAPPPTPAPARATPPPAAASPPPARPSRDVSAEKDLKVALEKFEAGLDGPAMADLESFVAEYEGHPAAAVAYLTMARIHQREGRPEQAMAGYVETSSRFPNSPQAAEAQYLLGEALADQRGRDGEVEARRVFGELVEAHPDSHWAPRALAAKAELEESLRIEVGDGELGRQVPAKIATLRQLARSYPEAAAAEAALWELGEFYEDEKLFDEAVQAFTELGERFPDTRLDTWWKAGQVYDRRLDDAQRAIEAYRKVPESSRQYRDAQKRITRLSD